MSPNRVVAILTPLVFAPLAGAVAAWLSQHFPGVEIDADKVQQVFVAGALLALAPAAQWLNGWQKHEARMADAGAGFEVADLAEYDLGAPVDEYVEELEEVDDFDDFEDLLDELSDNGHVVTTGGRS